MTTSLIEGLTFKQAVAAVVDAAEKALKPGDRIGFWTEHGKDKVLIGVAQPGRASFCLEVDKADYSGLMLAELLGISLKPTKNPHAAAVSERNRKSA